MIQFASMWECSNIFAMSLSLTTVMMTSSNGNIFPVAGRMCGEFTGTGEFPARSFDVFFDLWMKSFLFSFKFRWSLFLSV